MRARFVATALGLLLALLAASPARAAGFCESYPLTLPDKELAAYHRELSRIVPARYARIAHDIPIVNVPIDEDHYAPVVEEVSPGRYEIQIPGGFSYLLCWTAVIQTVLPGAMLTDREMRDMVGECVRETKNRSAIRCMYDIVRLMTEVVTEKGLEEKIDRHVVEMMMHGAMLTMILHEFGHVVGDHFAADKTDAEQEREADTFAVLGTVLYGEDSMGVFGASAMFSVFSIADRAMRNPPHGSFQCRGKSIKQVTFALWPSVFAVQAWPNADSAGYLRTRTADLMEDLTALFPGPLSDAQLASVRCAADRDRHLPAVSADLARIVATLDALARADPNGTGDPFAFYEPLAALNLATPEGRNIRASLIAARLGAMFVDVGDRSGRMIPTARYLRYVDRAFAESGQDIIARDYGQMLVNRASVRFAAQADRGAPRDADQVLRAVRADLLESLVYSQGSFRAYFTLFVLDQLAEDCTAARNWLTQAETFSSPQELEIVQWAMTAHDEEVARAGCKGIAGRMPLPDPAKLSGDRK